MLKIRRCRDRLIFNVGIPIAAKDGSYIESGPLVANLCVSWLFGTTLSTILPKIWSIFFQGKVFEYFVSEKLSVT